MTATELVEAARTADEQGRLSDAIEQAKAALEIEPGHEQAQVVLAKALEKSGQPGEAAGVVDALLRTVTDKPKLLFWHAVLLRKAGRFEEALASAERFVQAEPGDPEGHAHLGVLLGIFGRTDEAAARFGRAVQLNQSFPPYRFNLGHALVQLGRDAEAEPVLSDLVELAPDFTPGRLALGELYLRRGALAEAIAQGRLAAAAQPDNVTCHYLLVRALTERSANEGAGVDEAEAEKHIRMALALEPDSFVAHGMLGFALQEKGDFAAALPEFEASLRLNPRQGAAYYGLATCKKFSEEDGAYTNLVANAAGDSDAPPVDRAYAHYSLGKILEDQKNFERALREYDSANSIMFDLVSSQRPFDRREHENQASWVIETFSADFIQRHRGIGSPSDLPLVVVGMIRSGTTLVEQILSTHPQVVGAGELIFWHENAGRALAGGIHRLDAAAVAQVAADYVALLRQVGPAALRVTDKLPENFLYLGLIHVAFPDARIIHCRRHPVDTCLSIYATPYTNPAGFVYNRANIVFAYRQYLRLMAHWRRVIPADRLLEVDYEDIVANREKVTRQMVDFAGLEWNDACLHHERNDRPVKTLSRWQVRQPIYGSSVARWQNFKPWLDEFAELLNDAPPPRG